VARRSFPKRVVLKSVVAAMGAALVWTGCGREQGDVTAPNSRVPRFSQSVGQQAGIGETFVSFDYPGATFTTARSISPSGKILGTYGGAGGKQHGFLLFQGMFTTVPDVPGALWSFPNRLNAHGTVVGTYRDALKEHAYVFSGGTFTTINFPDPSISLTGWGINDDGDVVGVKFVEGDFLDGHGYVFSKNTFALFDVPGARGTFLTSITDSASIVGNYFTTDAGWHGFLLSGGKVSTIDFPNSSLNWVNDINPRGEIVGYYNDHDRVRHGFVYRNGAFKSIDPLGAIATQGLGINPQGDVVGGYVTPDGNTHGFFLACAACSLR
jgi:probable HAF family extracellular repeat protein